MTATKDKTSLSLGTRMVLLVSFLILLTVGVAVAATFVIGKRIAEDAVTEALERSAEAQTLIQSQYEDQLARLAGSFTDPYLTAYIAESIDPEDAEVGLSIRDILLERQADWKFDFAIMVDLDGIVQAHTERPGDEGSDLSDRPLVAEALRELNLAVGVWREEGTLYNAVAVPLPLEYDLIGFAITGYEITNFWAQDVSNSSGAELALVALPASSPSLVGNSRELGDKRAGDLVSELSSKGLLDRLERGEMEGRDPIEVELNSEPWMVRMEPLLDAGGTPVGASAAVASLEEQLRPFNNLLRWVIAAGLAATLLGVSLSYVLGKRTLAPVQRLAAAAEAARGGDYDQTIAVERNDEVGLMARGFNALLSGLREKRDMEAYVAGLSRTLPDGAGAAKVEPESRQVTLLGVDLRRFVSSKVSIDPEATMDRLSREIRRTTAAVTSRRGRLESVLGHRILASFDGDGKSYRALAAAAEILSTVGAPEDAFDLPTPSVVALSAGEVAAGAVVREDAPQPALVGSPVLKLEGVLKEALAGEITLSKEVFEELEESLTQAGIELSPVRGILTPLPLYRVDGSSAERVTGVSAKPATVKEGTGLVTLSGIQPGALFGQRFEILSILGAGGMGEVYKARDRELSEVVALKMLKRDMWSDPIQLARLKDELRLARKITHPNVLRTYDFGEVGGIPFISMEYVRGVTLRYLLDETDRLPYSAGLFLAKQLCAGLEAAHAQGVIHRDIKPENLIVESSGNAKLMDFGIARPQHRTEPGHTQEGIVVGTPQYLAPEQVSGQEVDVRSDLYAVGVVLFEIFTGSLPFAGGTPFEIVSRHLNEPPTPPKTYWQEIPEPLEALLLRCLAKAPADRYQSVPELVAELGSLRA